MALIRCPECGAEIPDNAAACTRCWCPIMRPAVSASAPAPADPDPTPDASVQPQAPEPPSPIAHLAEPVFGDEIDKFKTKSAFGVKHIVAMAVAVIVVAAVALFVVVTNERKNMEAFNAAIEAERAKIEAEQAKAEAERAKAEAERARLEDYKGEDPRTRTQQGVLNIVSGSVKGKSVASADIFGKGGFATDIDAILAGVNAEKSKSGGGSGATKKSSPPASSQGVEVKRSVESSGSSSSGSGFGGGGGGIDDILSGLTGGYSGGGPDLKKKGSSSSGGGGGVVAGSFTVSGSRSRPSIQRTATQHISTVRSAYSQRLGVNPGLSGTVTVKFAIDGRGGVVFAQVLSSTTGDSEFDRSVVDRVRGWAFENTGADDITEVTFPFTFGR